MAALDFPSSPTDGQIYTANGRSFRYNTATSSWTNLTGVGAGYTGSQGPVAPDELARTLATLALP